MNSNYSIVRREVQKAYGDKGQMIFRASQDLNPLDAFTLMHEVVHIYNNFEARAILLLPDSCRVTIAREHSVCLYIDSPSHPITSRIAKAMFADEFHIEDGITRLWWD